MNLYSTEQSRISVRAAYEVAAKPWPENYEPTEWVRSVVNRKWRGWDGIVYTCTAYDPRQGFWMVDGAGRCTNVSERAIGRTFHRVYESSSPQTE